MIKFLTVEQVIEIHDIFLEDHGGSFSHHTKSSIQVKD